MSLEGQLQTIKRYFIVERADYTLYTQEDQTKALAFRLLASAYIEDYVERRCIEIAEEGIRRLVKQQPTATGRAVVTRLVVRNTTRQYPIHDRDVVAAVDLAERALLGYRESVTRSHGIAGRDLRELVLPLGLRDAQVPDLLILGLDQLSKARDPASHTYINRARTMAEPREEWDRVEQLLVHLRALDADLEVACNTYPLGP